MVKLMLFVLCLAVMAVGGGFPALGMALGALGFGIGVLALVATGWNVLTR